MQIYHNKAAAIFLMILCLAAGCAPQDASMQTGERNERWATPVQAEGLPNLFQVTPEIYRSAQPTAAGMQSAQRMGIQTIVSFRTSNADPGLSKGTGLTLKRVPMTASSISDDELVAALRTIHGAAKPVLVHCMHGADRTGLTVAMYRMVFQGWSKEDAKNEMINGGYGFHSIWTNIPAKIDEMDITALRSRVLAGFPEAAQKK